MSAQVIPFVFRDDPVRILMRGGEPWFVARDVCRVLDIRQPETAYARIPDDERDIGLTNDTTGREQETVILSEPGLYRMIFRSDKPQAEEFRRWVFHEVLPAIRKTGRFGREAKPEVDPSVSNAELRSRIDIIREARMLFGAERARRMWPSLGLPEVPVVPDETKEDASECLSLLLGYKPEDGKTLRELLSDAFEGDESARLTCLLHGVRPLTDTGEGFLVANRNPALERIFAGSGYHQSRWKHVLRHCPGAQPAGKNRFGQAESRATFIPATELDPFMRKAV